MNFDYEHERFVNKNRSMASGYERDNRDKELEKKGFSHKQHQEEASCFNCKLKARCITFRKMQTGGTLGAASFTGNEKFFCEKYLAQPVQQKGVTNKQIKSLMKNFKKGRF